MDVDLREYSRHGHRVATCARKRSDRREGRKGERIKGIGYIGWQQE